MKTSLRRMVACAPHRPIPPRPVTYTVYVYSTSARPRKADR